MTFPYENTVDPSSVNMDLRKLSNVIEQFQNQQASGAFPGGQLVVRRSNKMVLNLVVGIARGLRVTESIMPIHVTPQTPFPVYSTGKSLAAIAMAILEERGLIDVNVPISDIVPEFSRHGKSHITILDVLTHTAGILIPSLYKDYKHIANREWVLEQIIDAKPRYKRGTFAYMPWEFGAILDEVVQRIIGKTLAEFFAEEIATPLNLPNLQYGLESLGNYMAMGRGFMLGTLMPSAYGWWNTKGYFGHGGAVSSLAFGYYKTGLSVAIVTNGNRSFIDFAKRFISLTHQIRKTCVLNLLSLFIFLRRKLMLMLHLQTNLAERLRFNYC